MDFRKLPKTSEVDEFHVGELDVKLIENNDENKDHIMDVVKSIYENEPCRICGQLIGDASKAVFAGYSDDNKSRCAHKLCWEKKIPQSEWAYPISSQ